MSMRAVHPIYSVFQLTAAGALLAWCVVSLYEDRQLDQCSRDINRQIQYNQARLNTIRLHRESLQARTAETAKTLTAKRGG
jgi:hypothetical protein